MSFSFEHSALWIVPILLIAAFLAWWLYFSRPNEEWSKRLISLLSGLRWITLVTLGLFLLHPYLIRLIEEAEKPKLLVYVDASRSVDSSEVESMMDWVNGVGEELSERYDVHILNFASNTFSRDELSSANLLETDLGAVIEGANQDFYGDNIGAVVIATDGIQTQGVSPLYIPIESGAAVYTVGMGDSTTLSDVEVSEILVNKIAFLNNDIEVKTRLRATKAAGETLSISLLKNGEEVDKREVIVESALQASEVVFETSASQLGQNEIFVVVNSGVQESNTANNSKSAFIDVLDNRTKIQIISNSPHPDVAAIKRAIELSDQYEVEVALVGQWDQDVNGSDLFILHGIPSDVTQVSIIRRLLEAEKPTWLFVSSQSDLTSFNELDYGVVIRGQRKKSDEVTARFNEDFGLFNLPKVQGSNRMPPVISPFGEYQLSGDLNVALFQQFGEIETERPLLAFYTKDGVKHGVMLAEGLWRWKLSQRGQEEWVESIIRKTVQFLALRQKRTRLEVNIPPVMQEQIDVIAKAEAYNETFELTSDAEINLSVIDSSGNSFDYVLRPKGQAFELNLGKLPPGAYTWKADAVVGSETFKKDGSFVISKNESEFQQSQASYNELIELSKRNKGEFFLLSELEGLSETLRTLESAKPVLHSTRKWSDITELKWLAIVLILLISTEWFLRKYNGSV